MSKRITSRHGKKRSAGDSKVYRWRRVVQIRLCMLCKGETRIILERETASWPVPEVMNKGSKAEAILPADVEVFNLTFSVNNR